MTSPIDKLVHALGKLPGVGERTATRLAFFLLRAPKQIAKDLSEALKELHDKVKLCSVCCNIADKDPCRFCSGGRRDQNLICVVEEPSDVSAIEKTGAFRGVYHVVGEEVDVLDKNKQSPAIKRLLERIAYIQKQLPPEKQKEMEIILATNANVEGDALALYLENIIKPIGARVARLGRGLASGAELEYADKHTLMNAMESRK